MDEKDWPLTSKATAESERASGPDEHDLSDDAEPVQGNRLLQELVAQGVLEEVSPGHYWARKLRSGVRQDAPYCTGQAMRCARIGTFG